ncbi:alpha mannosidase-like protein [Tulasnella sp. JGI-2019a]|nr:alpha mannosidase-like protein [Tulasnella sp. JGI-2019a]
MLLSKWLQGLIVSASGNQRSPHNQAYWNDEKKLSIREEVRALWNHGFDSYMDNAFPMDELQPLSCKGRGPNWEDLDDYSANDVNGNYSITLIDVLDTLVTLGNPQGFEKAVRQVIDHVSFDVDTRPQVFETTIRVLGGLLSAHQLITPTELPNISPRRQLEPVVIPWYRGELLEMALDLGQRLLPAFDTPTGLPYARVNLRTGVPPGETNQTCAAGAGTLLLEFTVLSRLTGDSRFEQLAKKSYNAVWKRRSSLDLVGNPINVVTGEWDHPYSSGIGAGIDSFHEYALKMYVLTGETPYFDIWNKSYAAIMEHSRGIEGYWYRAIGMYNGELSATHVDSLGAFWPGLQVLAGDIENAIKAHLVYWNMWRRYSGIPETFSIVTKEGLAIGYPLRPEFIESTYFLYRATKDPFYLSVGERVLQDLTARAKVPCGLATVGNLVTGEQDDRMESFVLSETLKYLFLLFDEDNPLNSLDSNFVFTTEGHVLQLQPADLKHADSSPKADETSRQQETCARHDETSSLWPSLVGSIRSRSDYEYARHLVGIPANATEVEDDSPQWDPHSKCDVPKHEIFYSDFVLTPQGNRTAEDLNPGLDKILPVEEGFMVYNVEGIRIKATTTVDLDGYSVYQVGTHAVKASQKIYFADRRLLRNDDGMDRGLDAVHQLHRERLVPLRFSLERSYAKGVPASQSILSAPKDLLTDGITANFGNHPAKEMKHADWVATTPRFGRGWPSLPLARPPAYNEYGCRAHTSSTVYEEELYYDNDSPFLPRPYEGMVVLLKRGECTFFEKLDLASMAGASGIVITSDEPVTPTLLPEEDQFQTAQMYLSHVGLVIVSGAQNVEVLEKMVDLSQTSSSGMQVMVHVEADAPVAEVVKEEKKPAIVVPLDKREMHASLRKQIPSRPLYINNKRVKNSVLLF